HGAKPLGIHLEGPWINPEFTGAQNREYIKEPSIKDFKALYEIAGSIIKQLTIAPELPGAMELIRLASSLGIVVSAGHTNADYEIGLESVKAGVRKATHLFNAMVRFNHRKPGIVLALLQSPEVYLELIVDFVHLHPAVVRFVVEYAGSDRVVVVSDSIAAADMPDGKYKLGGLEVEVVGGVCKLSGRDVLAGSTLTMDVAFRNLLSLNYSLSDAVKITSLTPAKSVGVNSRGDIAPGFYADLAMLNEKLHVEKTFINGELVYER
ncbi:MAG: N-acetylglucosamine-6-phosphate deacetylase, partial [Thermosphaera sp.]